MSPSDDCREDLYQVLGKAFFESGISKQTVVASGRRNEHSGPFPIWVATELERSAHLATPLSCCFHRTRPIVEIGREVRETPAPDSVRCMLGVSETRRAECLEFFGYTAGNSVQNMSSV